MSENGESVVRITANWCYALLPLVLLTTTVSKADEEFVLHPTTAYCYTETFSPRCDDPSHVPLMLSAEYGRMRFGRCIEVNLGHIGCAKDVLSIVDARCSGRQECEIRVPDAKLEETRPCLAALKTYLEVSYTCVQVFTVAVNDCLSADQFNLTKHHGFISSHINSRSVCGRLNIPWVIRAQPGQRINVTLYDFTLSRRDMNFGGTSYRPCDHFGTIHEESSHELVNVCGGQQRTSHVFTSSGHVLTILTNTAAEADDLSSFLLQYEVLGCPDLTPPDGGSFKKEGEYHASVTCTNSGVRWQLTCRDNVWMGATGNCTGAHAGESGGRRSSAGIDLSYGVAIGIIAIAAIPVGLIILIIGILRFRRRNSSMETVDRRETIALRQKCQELTPHGASSSSPCSLATNSGTTYSPCTSHCEHTPQRGRRTIRINGNEYEHIWESPLPRPSSVATATGKDARTYVVRQKAPLHGGQTLAREKPHYLTARDIYRPSPEHECRSGYPISQCRRHRDCDQL